MYTLDNITTAPSYDALKRNGFSDIDVVAYYGTAKVDRGTMFIQIRTENQRVKFNLPKPHAKAVQQWTEKVGTQKCTSKADIDSIRDMALDYISRDWNYCGRIFNLTDLGWSFAFNDKKRANGQCYPSRKKIYLSQWIAENSQREMSGWINTMVHEIAHAVNEIMGGKGHDWLWRDIFTTFGGSGERCSSDVTFGDLVENPVSKYTIVCVSCGMHTPSHKIRRRKSACGKCCKEKNGGRYTTKYLLKQIQNY